VRRAAPLLLALAVLAACGYHLQGRGVTVPPSVKTVAVLPFARLVAVLELDQRVTEAVTREFVQRARVRVQSTPDGADAVLQGAVSGFGQVPVSYDPATGRANRVRVEMDARVTLTGADGKVLYRNDGFHFEEIYDRNSQAGSFIQDEAVSYDVIARDFSRALVSAILEGETGA